MLSRQKVKEKINNVTNNFMMISSMVCMYVWYVCMYGMYVWSSHLAEYGSTG